MKTDLDNPSRKKLKKNGLDKNRGAIYTLQKDKRGHHYNHLQQGRVKVVTLFCNCGRSVLVNTTDAKRSSAMCGLCNSPFRWQQLTFNTD